MPVNRAAALKAEAQVGLFQTVRPMKAHQAIPAAVVVADNSIMLMAATWLALDRLLSFQEGRQLVALVQEQIMTMGLAFGSVAVAAVTAFTELAGMAVTEVLDQRRRAVLQQVMEPVAAVVEMV
jgi:hypothetical protein